MAMTRRRRSRAAVMAEEWIPPSLGELADKSGRP
jgi:hypothetical protein